MSSGQQPEPGRGSGLADSLSARAWQRAVFFRASCDTRYSCVPVLIGRAG